MTIIPLFLLLKHSNVRQIIFPAKNDTNLYGQDLASPKTATRMEAAPAI